jgi:hypothetical protein
MIEVFFCGEKNFCGKGGVVISEKKIVYKE